MNDVKDLIAELEAELEEESGRANDEHLRYMRSDRGRSELAAVIEKVRSWIGTEDDWWDEDDGPVHAPVDLHKILNSVPADLLREHDANVIHVWTARVRTELDATAIGGINLGRDYLEGVYSALQQADDHAARLLNDIPYRVKPEDER